jgi:tape measure domain-containing protein
MAAGLSFKIGADTTALGKGLSRAQGMVGKFGRSVQSIGLGALKLGAVGAGVAMTALAFGIRSAVKEASKMENFQVAFTAITGSASEAADMLSYFRAESERTGISVGAMAQSVTKLMANGMDAELAKKMTRSLLDVAGTLGMSEQNASLLGTALAQVKAKGVASMEELRQQIAEKGVPIFEVLAQKMGVTTGELIKMVSQGKVSADVVMDAFANLEGPLEKFRGGAEKMAQTTSGSFRRLKAVMAGVFMDTGAPLMDGVSRVVSIITDKLKQWGPMIKSWAASAGRFLSMMVTAFSAGELGGIIKDSMIVAVKSMVSGLWAGVKGVMAFMITTMREGVKSAWSKIIDPSFWSGVLSVLKAGAVYLEAAAVKLVNAMTGGMHDDSYDILISSAKGTLNSGLDRMAKSGDGRTPLDIMKEGLTAFQKSYAEGIDNPLLDPTEEMKRLLDALTRVHKLNEERKEKDDTSDEPVSVATAVAKAVGGFIKPQVTALQRVGGESLGNAAMNMDQERNKLLRSIESKVGRPTQGVWA